MILEVARLVTKHCGVSEATAKLLQVAYLKTTEPTFLVFASNQSHPLFVVKVGLTTDLECRLARLARLYDLLPGALAKPIGVFPVAPGRAMLVQAGLPGIPWFRLGDRYSTSEAWLALRARAIRQLHAFHDAVAGQTDWVTEPVRFDAELRALGGELTALLAPLGPAALALVDEAVRTLSTLPLRGLCQHGDFVLNNLLVDDTRLGIVDLDDFGKWRAPWVDTFALGVSVHLHATQHVSWHHRAHDLATCLAGSATGATFTPRQAIAMYVYYLLSALSDTLNKPTRAAVRSHYLGCLRELLADGPRYAGAFEQPAGREAQR